MATFNHSFSINTRGFSDVRDLSPAVAEAVDQSGISSGMVTVFVPGSTASVTTIEFESGAVEDLREAIERIAPQSIQYSHNERWGDGNGFAHVRSALLGPSVTVPLSNGTLQLGTWQQIVLVDFDNRARKRNVIVQIIGE